MAGENHDPLPREMEGEPHFALMGRDPFAPFIVRLYGAFRERRIDRAQDIFRNLCQMLPKFPFHPMSDPEHARSAAGVATQMDLWLLYKTREQLGNVDLGRRATVEIEEPSHGS